MIISGIFFYSSNEKMSTLITQGMPSEITTNFHVDSRLGKGASGQVYLIKDKVSLFFYLHTYWNLYVCVFCYF